MSEFWYVASNGRCGTQFLARQLSMVADGEQIVHERMSLRLSSRTLFRNPEALYSHLGRSPDLQGFFVRLTNRVKNGERQVFCGWPAFAWLDYMMERFSGKFRFVHLVRNPYDNAASHCTHHAMSITNLSRMEKLCKVFGTDPKVKFSQFADRYNQFGPFERQLLHWLEVTSFIHEHSAAPEFRGLFRFEDLVASDDTALNEMMSQIIGREVQASEAEPFDRVHKEIPWPLEFHVDPQLRAEVDALAKRLGYSQEVLDQAMNPERLQAIYCGKRFDLPCDPSISVISKT